MNKGHYHDRDRVSALSNIVDVIASTSDMVEIFKVARQSLNALIPCDQVTIIYNNESTRYFSILPALNGLNESTKEVTIPYKETSLTEILRTRSSILRSDLTGRGKLSPGDLKFLTKGVASDLSVPILYKKQVLAIINLASFEVRAFNAYHQAIVEEVAVLLTLVFERSKLTHEMEFEKEDAGRWRKKYTSLLENSSDAVVIVNYDQDMIYETNKAFEILTGYSAQQLHGMRYSLVHPGDRYQDLVKMSRTLAQGKTAELTEFPLLRRDGRQVPVSLRLATIGNGQHPLLLAMYRDLRREQKSHEEIKRRSQELLSFMKAGQTITPTQSLPEMIGIMLSELGAIQKAKYISLHLKDEDTAELKLVRAFRFPENENTSLNQPWLMGLSEGPYAEVMANASVVYYNVHRDSRFQKWRPIAEKIGYTSVLCLPLIPKEHPIGVLSLFFEKVRQFKDEDINFLKAAVIYLAISIENHKLSQVSKERAKQIAVITEISNAINSSLDLEEVICTTALETKKVINFDQATITLFDNSGENVQVFTLASETYGKMLGSGQWEPLGKSELGWVRNEEGIEGEKLKSKISVLLLSRNKFLGTFSLFSLEPHTYSRHHLEFLEQIASQIATAIENARLFQEANKRLTEVSVLADISKSITSSLDLDEMLSHIANATAAAMGAKLCTIRFVEDNQPLPRIASNLPQMGPNMIIERERSEFAPHIIKNLKPYFIENLNSGLNDTDDTKTKGDQSSKEKKQEKLSTYLGVPVISRGQAIAILSVYWETMYSVSERESKFLSTIANQTASAMENARLYEQTLKNTEKLEKANEELESFLYTVSHDLKSPVVSIQGFTSIMLSECQGILNEENIHYLERIQNNANQMEKLIEDLLELSRIGRVVSPFEEVETSEIIGQAVSELMYQLESKKVNVNIPQDLPKIYCDCNRMVQVFINLLDNAIKYSSSNPRPRIDIGYQDKGEFDLFYVKDNGIGIKKEYHQQVFGLFRSLRQGSEPSTGVGLTIVKKIIDNHGGQVWLDSEEGKGATFYFTIPKKAPSAGARG